MNSFLPDLGRLLGRPAPVSRRRRDRVPTWFDGKPPVMVDDGDVRFDWFSSSADLARGLLVIESDGAAVSAARTPWAG